MFARSRMLFLFVLLIVSKADGDTELTRGNIITREISGGEFHNYQLSLMEGQYAKVIVDQSGIDLAVELHGIDGKQITVFDHESRNQGREDVVFVAKATGNYTLVVSPTFNSQSAGHYEISLTEIRTATELDNRLYEANKLLVEAMNLQDAGKFDEAVTDAENGKQIFEQTLGTDSLDYARALEILANLYLAKKDYLNAEPLYSRALEIKERTLGTEHPDVAASCHDMARFYSAKGDSAKAESLLQRALTIREQTLDNNHFYIGYTLLDYGKLLFDEQKYLDSEQMLQRAATILQTSLGNDNPQYSNALHLLGYLYDRTGDWERAEQFYSQELASREKLKGKNSTEAAKVLGFIARVNFRRGEYEDAESMYQRSLDIYKELRDEDGYLVALTNLANVYVARGDYQRGEDIYKKALKRRKEMAKPNEIPDQIRIAHALASLGEISNGKGDYTTAEEYLLTSLPIIEGIGKIAGFEEADILKRLDSGDTSRWTLEQAEDEADILTRLATAYLGKGELTKAEQKSRRALSIFEKIYGPDHPLVADGLNALARIAYLKGDLAETELLFNRALEITQKGRGTNAPEMLQPLNGLADLYIARGEIDRAIDIQARANTVDEHNLALAMSTGSERQKLSYLSASRSNLDRTLTFNIDHAPKDPKAAELAAMTILRLKGRALDSMADTLSSLRSRADPQDKNLFDQLNQATAQFAQRTLNAPGTMLAAETRKLEGKIEKLEDEMSRRSAEFRSQKQPATLDSIGKAIPQNAVLIEFALYRPFNPKASNEGEAYGDLRYVCYVVRNQGEVQWKELAPAKEIDQATDNFRQAQRDPMRKDVKELARILDEKIMQPIRPLLGNASQLLISPDGKLNLIPFEALIDKHNHYLVEQYTCTYLTSGRDLLRLQVRRESKAAPVVLADPIYGEPKPIKMADAKVVKTSAVKRRSVTTGSDLSDVYFASLAGTAQEAHAIQLLFPQAKVLKGKEATESAIKQVIAPRILHIATHGFFLTDSPSSSIEKNGSRSINATAKIENPLLRSGLAFAGANIHSQNNDDGILTALEASGLNLWGTKLVTLSACDTGLGEVRNGDGVYGLRRAFVLAGTESLVMSLWGVNDYVTREMMTKYYKGLKNGLGRGEALRQVKLGMLKDKKKQHPYYWASFIQSGEWANLHGQR